MLQRALEETHPQLAEDEQVAPVAVGQLAGAVKPARVIRVRHRIIGQRGRDRVVGHVAQRIRDRMRQAVAAIPHAAELVGVQQPFMVGVGMHRPAAGGQLHLAHVGGPGIIVEVGADLDDVLADERHRLMMIAQTVMRAHLVPHGGHSVEAVGNKIGFLVVDRGEDARAGGECHRAIDRFPDPQAMLRIESPAGRRDALRPPRPAGCHAAQRLIPGADAAEGVGRLHIARAHGHRGVHRVFRRHVAQQRAQEAGDRGVARPGRTDHINLETGRP